MGLLRANGRMGDMSGCEWISASGFAVMTGAVWDPVVSVSESCNVLLRCLLGCGMAAAHGRVHVLPQLLHCGRGWSPWWRMAAGQRPASTWPGPSAEEKVSACRSANGVGQHSGGPDVRSMPDGVGFPVVISASSIRRAPVLSVPRVSGSWSFNPAERLISI